jgi:hypothetical protein
MATIITDHIKGRAPFPGNGGDQSGSERRAAGCGGTLSADSPQARVLKELPVGPLVSDERMARRFGGCVHHGTAPQLLLSWMLLDIDGPALYRRRHEFALGGCDCSFRVAEKILNWGELAGRVTGGAMVAAGVAHMARLW